MSILIGPKGHVHAQNYQKSAKAAAGEFSPGMKSESVGQRAKEMVANGDFSGPNAVGKAASMIARMDLMGLVPPPGDELARHEEGSELHDPVEVSEKAPNILPAEAEQEEDAASS